MTPTPKDPPPVFHKEKEKKKKSPKAPILLGPPKPSIKKDPRE